MRVSPGAALTKGQELEAQRPRLIGCPPSNSRQFNIRKCLDFRLGLRMTPRSPVDAGQHNPQGTGQAAKSGSLGVARWDSWGKPLQRRSELNNLLAEPARRGRVGQGAIPQSGDAGAGPRATNQANPLATNHNGQPAATEQAGDHI